MNNSHRTSNSADQSALSLLVNAAEGSREARQQESLQQQPSFANQLRQAGLGREGGGLSLEEQLLLQQQLQGSFGGGGSVGLLNQLREQNLLSQYGQQQQQQQQLAMLLGLGGGQGLGGGHQADVHSALAAQLRQQAQQPHFTSADLLALSRSGGLGALSGILGGGGGLGAGGANSFASELEGLQRLEELERRQRLLAAAAAGGGLGQSAAGVAGMTRAEQPDSAASPMLLPKTGADDPRLPVPSRPMSSANVGSARKKYPGMDMHVGIKQSAGGLGVMGSSDENKEELEKAPGSVIVPCRARGMPMDHNFKTAYFVIPENVKHGEELICSYFACRNAGIKFRYCSHCKVPVAKRNFRKRHKHGGEDVAKLPGEDSDAEEEAAAAKKGIPSQITAGHKAEVEADGISSQSTDSNQQDKAVGLANSAVRDFGNSKKQAAAAVALPISSSKVVADRKPTSEREERWLSLLTKRPATKDGEAMSGWLMEVLAVSDLDTPLKQPGEVGVSEGVIVSDEPKPPVVSTKEDVDTPSSEEYHSSSDDSSAKKDQEMQESHEENSKKRSTDALAEAAGAAGEGKYASGSFAAWKERKKQKKQAKTDSDALES